MESLAEGAALALDGPAVLLAEQGPALDLVQAAPHPVGLAGPERVVEAVHPHGASRADGLGPGLAAELLLAAFEVPGSEEERGVLSAAGSPELPGGCGVARRVRHVRRPRQAAPSIVVRDRTCQGLPRFPIAPKHHDFSRARCPPRAPPGGS